VKIYVRRKFIPIKFSLAVQAKNFIVISNLRFADRSVPQRYDVSLTGYDTVQSLGVKKNFSVDRASSLFRVEVSTAGDNKNLSSCLLP
jgi:hypothetical protein